MGQIDPYRTMFDSQSSRSPRHTSKFDSESIENVYHYQHAQLDSSQPYIPLEDVDNASNYCIPPPAVPPQLNDPTRVDTIPIVPVFQHQQYYNRWLDFRHFGLIFAILTVTAYTISYYVLDNKPILVWIYITLILLSSFLLFELLMTSITCILYPLCSQKNNNPKRGIRYPTLTSKRFNIILISILGIRVSLLVITWILYLIFLAATQQKIFRWGTIFTIIAHLCYCIVAARHFFSVRRGYKHSQYSKSSNSHYETEADNNNAWNDPDSAEQTFPLKTTPHYNDHDNESNQLKRSSSTYIDKQLPLASTDWIHIVYSNTLDDTNLSQTIY